MIHVQYEIPIFTFLFGLIHVVGMFSFFVLEVVTT